MAGIFRGRLFGTLTMMLLLSLIWVRPMLAQTSAIVINAVDDSAFPQVSVTATVQGTSVAGRPLTVADFQLFEEGQRVPASSILIESGDRQPLSLVIAVDVSTEATDLVQIQNGLLSLIGRMSPGDQAMIISFFDDVRLVQPLTADLDQLRTAIRQLSAGGNFTALNRATVEAFTQAQSLPQAQRAVLIVTDSVENISNETVNIVSAGAIPAYVVAYSPKVQAPGAMASFAQQIGADLTLVETATAAQVRLQTLAIGSGSRTVQIRFTSSIPADNGDHTISINLSEGSAEDRDNGIFRARSGTVTIDTPSLTNGARVGGLLSITPEITAPSPVRQVEYLLNGQSLAVLDTPPYTYAIDTSTVTPGNNVIGLRALDSAGNRAEHLVTVTVIDPLQINVRTQPERYYLGDQIQVIADVTALNGVSSVDFLLNDIVVAEVVTPPYTFMLDTTGYSAGAVPLTVRARDATGYVESIAFPVELAAPPPRFFFTENVWLRIFAVLSIVLAIVLVWLLLTFLATLARRQRRARFLLELRNEGNGPSAYLLRADDPKGLLTFSFLLKGLRLQGRSIIEWEAIRQPQPKSIAVTSSRQASPTMIGQALPGAISAATVPTAGTAQKATGAAQGAKKSATKRFGQIASYFTMATRAFSGLFGALANFLPASMGGAALGRAASGAQGAYSKSMSVYRVNQEVEGAATAVQDGRNVLPAGSGQPFASVASAQARIPQPATQAIQVAPSGMVWDAPAQVAVAPTSAAPTLSDRLPAHIDTNGHQGNGHHTHGLDSTDLRTDANGVTYRRVVRHIPDSAWTETPEIAPGDTLSLELVIEPNRVGWTKSYPFQIRSVPVAESAGSPSLTEELVKIRGVSWLLWFFLPLLVVAVAAAIVLFMVGFLLAEFGFMPMQPIPWLPFDLL
ncbi:VWA domain-containing protein [bacterium]|nr:VWA domain-containing protein [bacterium]